MENLLIYLQSHQIVTLGIVIFLILWALLWVLLPFCVFFIYRESVVQRQKLNLLLKYQKDIHKNGLKVRVLKGAPANKFVEVKDPEYYINF